MKSNELVRELKFSRIRFFVILLLVLVGIGLCVELGYIFYKTNFLEVYEKSFCAVSELIDCDGVSKTEYSMLFGVPNALWGMLLYLVILMLLFVDRIQMKFKNTIFDVFKNPRSYIATLALLGFIISMGLAFISIYEIKKICVLCFVTYFVDFFIALVAVGKNFFINDIKNTIVDVIDGAKKHFILLLIVVFVFSGALYYLNDTLILSPRMKKERQFSEFFKAKTNKYAQKGNILGNKKADVVVNIYSDYLCPHCRAVNIMIHKAARQEKIMVNEINFPLDTTCNYAIGRTLRGHEMSCLYSKYALAAQKQGKFWGAANILFDYAPKNEDELIKMFEDKLKINPDKLKQDAYSSEIEQKIAKDINISMERQLRGTPAIEINGVIYIGAMPYDELIDKIQKAQKRASIDKKENK